MILVYNTKTEQEHLRIAFTVYSSADVKNAKTIYSDEVKVKNEATATENNFTALTWVITKIRPLMEQGLIPTDKVLLIHVPITNIFNYIPESAKVPSKYANAKLKLDTELDFFPFDLEFVLSRKLANKVEFQGEFADLVKEENKALSFFATLE